jgi:hypothetical protein
MCAQKNSVYFSLVSGTGAFSLSGGTTLCSMNSDCYEEFIMDAEDVTDLLIARIDFTQFASAFRPLIVDWGDGSETIYTTAGSNTNIAHTYSSPYTGPVKIRIADLTKITVLHLIEVFGTGVQPTAKSLIITGTQITKLNGLTSLFCTLATLNCTTSQLPRTLITLNSVLGNLSGNITGLPTNIQTLSLGTHGVGGTVYPNGNTLSGNVVDFKGTLRSIAVYGTNTLTGDINTMPTNVKNLSTSFQVAGSNTITGDLETTFNSNTVMTNFTLLGNNTVYGDLDGNGIVPAFASTNMVTFQITGMSYPSGTTSGAFGHMSNLKTLVLEFDENMPLPWPTNIGTSLTGSVFSLPNTINFLLLAGANTVSGDIIDIPSGVYVGETSYINIRGIATGWQPGGGNTINGLVDDIPTNCRFFTISGKNTIGGDIANIPAVSNLVTVRIGSSFQTVFGNLWDLPAQIKVFELTSGTGVITYVPPVPYPSITVSKTWATGFNRIWIKPASSVLSVNDMDQLLIDIADVTWANSSSFPVKDFWVYGTGPSYRSAISDTAYNNLIAQGVTIQYS